MLVVADAVGVDEVGVLEAQFFHLGVHGLDAPLDGPAAEVFGQDVGGVVGAGHGGGVEQILERGLLPFLEGDMAGVGARQGVDVVVADGAQGVPAALGFFTGQAHGHHLGDGGGVEFHIHILPRQHKAGVGVDDAVGQGIFQRRPRRPGGQGRQGR